MRLTTRRPERSPASRCGARTMPAGNSTAATSATRTVTSRPAWAARSFAIDCGSSPDTSIFATPTVSRPPIPLFPREYEQDKIFAKVTWRLAPGWQLTQSVHDEFWSNPETPSATKPREATQRLDASVPAINFGHLIHTASPNTVWDVRVGQVPLHAGHVADLGRSDDPQSHRPARKHLERRPSANRPGAASADDGQGDRHPLSSGVVRRGSRMENGRASRSGRASRGGRPTDWRELCLQKRGVEAAHAAGARQLGRSVRHRRRVRERRRPAGRPSHDQSGTALRSQPRHQSGRAGVRRVRARDRTDDQRAGHRGLLEHRVAARRRCRQAR